MDIVEYNRQAWDRESLAGSPWTTPVDTEAIHRARRGEWSVILTPNRPVPSAWLGDIAGRQILCLASGGGQQAPVLAAAGGIVTSYDLSDEQLAKDQLVADRDGLSIRCIQGDMADMSALASDAFDLIFHPVSNAFVPDVAVVWRNCFRVLRPGGALLAGFMNPSFYLFDHDQAEQTGKLYVKHRLPHVQPDHFEGDELAAWQDRGEAAEFSHSLASQIGGQLAAGLVLTDLYEDWWSDDATPLNRYSPTTIATRAIKPASMR